MSELLYTRSLLWALSLMLSLVSLVGCADRRAAPRPPIAYTPPTERTVAGEATVLLPTPPNIHNTEPTVPPPSTNPTNDGLPFTPRAVASEDRNRFIRSHFSYNDGRVVLVPSAQSVDAQGVTLFDGHMVLRVEVFDSRVGEFDGAGIAQVSFLIVENVSGETVFANHDAHAPFCLFGGDEPLCTPWHFGQHGLRWPSGEPIYNERYTLLIEIAAISGERPQWQWTFQIGGAGARPLVDGASEPAPGDGETVDFSGAWYTNFAEVALQQDGATVSGHYTRYGQVENLRLTGAVTTNRLEGYFGEDPADRFFFVLGLDGNTLTGSWFSHSDDAHDWCGTRVGAGALPAGCGFSGNWLLSGGPGIDGQPDGPFMAQLEQIGSDVSGTVVAADPSATQPGAALVHGTIIANLGTVGAAPFYTASGLFTINGNSYSLRWTLLDFNSIQFQGCWATDTGVYPWCGWREDSVATIQCPTAPSCP